MSVARTANSSAIGRKTSGKLPWLLLITFVAVFTVVELIGILLDLPLVFIPIALLFATLAALIVFGRRAQGSAYRQVVGSPARPPGCSRACAATGG